MKKRLLIVAGVILVVALAFGMGFWKEAQATNQKMEHILDLSRILTLAENRGTDWATDELMINEIETFSKKNLYKKWGNPTESAEGAKEDIWIGGYAAHSTQQDLGKQGIRWDASTGRHISFCNALAKFHDAVSIILLREFLGRKVPEIIHSG